MGRVSHNCLVLVSCTVQEYFKSAWEVSSKQSIRLQHNSKAVVQL